VAKENADKANRQQAANKASLRPHIQYPLHLPEALLRSTTVFTDRSCQSRQEADVVTDIRTTTGSSSNVQKAGGRLLVLWVVAMVMVAVMVVVAVAVAVAEVVAMTMVGQPIIHILE
jgi:hypothetical protein